MIHKRKTEISRKIFILFNSMMTFLDLLSLNDELPDDLLSGPWGSDNGTSNGLSNGSLDGMVGSSLAGGSTGSIQRLTTDVVPLAWRALSLPFLLSLLF